MSGRNSLAWEPAEVSGASSPDAPLGRVAAAGGGVGPEAKPRWIDAHVHIFPPEMIERRESYLPRDERFASLYSSARARMATAEDVLVEMDATGIGLSIVFGFPFVDQGLCRVVNDYVMEAVGAWPERLAGLACVSPRDHGSVAELERCLDAGLRGCGELAPGEGADDRESLGNIAAVLRERGLPLLLHANEPVGHEYPGKKGFGPAACVACAESYPGLKLVFAHMGGGAFLYEAMPELRRVLADVYYDTAAVPYLYDPGLYQAFMATAGEQKLIFGSDYALLSPKRYWEGLSTLPPVAQAAACHGNARKVFKL